MDLEAKLLDYILSDHLGKRRHGRAMRAVVVALLEGGARNRNVLEGICEHNGDAAAKGLDKLLLLDIVVMRGQKRGAVYDLSPRAKRAARGLRLAEAA